jgi:hypothetical protein
VRRIDAKIRVLRAKRVSGGGWGAEAFRTRLHPGSAAEAGGTRGSAAHGQRRRTSAEGTTIPTNFPPRDPADWSDLMVREITRTESQGGNCLSPLGFSQGCLAGLYLPSHRAGVPGKSLRERIFPRASTCGRTVRRHHRARGRRQDKRRTVSE